VQETWRNVVAHHPALQYAAVPGLQDLPLAVVVDILQQWRLTHAPDFAERELGLALVRDGWGVSGGPCRFGLPVLSVAGVQTQVVVRSGMTFASLLAATAAALGVTPWPPCWRLLYGPQELTEAGWPHLMFGPCPQPFDPPRLILEGP
jgi:hypothetical protein